MDTSADSTQFHLCDACSSVCSTPSDIDRLTGDTGYALHANLQGLKDSAAQGCRFCQLLTNAQYASSVLYSRYLESPDQYEVFLQGQRDRNGNLERVELHVVKNQAQERAMRLERSARGERSFGWTSRMLMSPDWKPPALSRRRRNDVMMVLKLRVRPAPEHDRDLNVFTLHAENDFAWGIVRKWAGACARHPRCGHPVPLLPSLVLDVGVPQPGGAYDDPKLLIGNGLAGRYVALSYCWGGPQKAVTTSANLQARLQRVPIDELSQSIADAITVCRNLNLRYLWVDALCIVQDDETGKLSEIARMHEIYKNATVTVIAAAARSAAEGFLRPTALPSCALPFASTTGDDARIALLSAAVVDEKETSSKYWSPDAAILWAPIDERAWTCQQCAPVAAEAQVRRPLARMGVSDGKREIHRRRLRQHRIALLAGHAGPSSREPLPRAGVRAQRREHGGVVGRVCRGFLLAEPHLRRGQALGHVGHRRRVPPRLRLDVRGGALARIHRCRSPVAARPGVRGSPPGSAPYVARDQEAGHLPGAVVVVDFCRRTHQTRLQAGICPCVEVAEILRVIREHLPGAPFGRLLSCTLIVIAQLCPMRQLLQDDDTHVDELTFDFEPEDAPEDDRDGCSLLWLVETLPEPSSDDDDDDDEDDKNPMDGAGIRGRTAGLIVMPDPGKEASWRRIGIFHGLQPKYFEGQQ